MNIIVNSFGIIKFNHKEYKCTLGRSGVTDNKKEGDGATPLGYFPIREVLYRGDRLEKPDVKLPLVEIHRDDGWCDDVNSNYYNKRIKLPFEGNHEKLQREDNLYNIIVVLGYNDEEPIPGKGSAIFMHIARPNYSPTAGCVALAREDLLEILSECDQTTLVCVQE